MSKAHVYLPAGIIELDQDSPVGCLLSLKNSLQPSASLRSAAFKINRSIMQESTPQRITDIPYWVMKHCDIAASDWRLPQVKSPVNSAACHQDAEAGTFMDGAMRIPRQ